jgi:hypothetical protein
MHILSKTRAASLFVLAEKPATKTPFLPEGLLYTNYG